MLILLIIIGMIYGVGHWQWKECRRRRAFEEDALRDRQQLREVAETAASEAASCAAVIERLGKTKAHRKLRAVRDEPHGVSTWQLD
jgi:hypothetical protein